MTPELAVYRYSESKLLEYLRKKTARLAEPRVSELSKTVVRSLAKDGLMDDGKEELLQRMLYVSLRGQTSPLNMFTVGRGLDQGGVQ